MLGPDEKKKKLIRFATGITGTNHKALVGVDNVEEPEEHVCRNNLEISVRTWSTILLNYYFGHLAVLSPEYNFVRVTQPSEHITRARSM